MEAIKSKLEKIFEILDNRELVLSIILSIIAILYIIQLFSLQIINGASYREQAENKIVRTEYIAASRGEIYDRNGVVLATNKLAYNIELYRTKVGAELTNDAIRDLADILIANNDRIYSSFPINDSQDNFSQDLLEDNEARIKFLENIKLSSDATFEDVINYYTELYVAENYSYEDKIKIIKVNIVPPYI